MLRWFLSLMLVATLGCAGFRSGWVSVPTPSGATPATPRTPYELAQLRTVRIGGWTLQLDFEDRRVTSEREVVLYVVPVKFSHPDASKDGGPLLLSVRLKSAPAGGHAFDPRLVRLVHDAEVRSPVAIWRVDRERMQVAWRAYAESRGVGNRPDAATWSEPVEGVVEVPGDEEVQLTLEFTGARPERMDGWTLDLRRALGLGDEGRIPLRTIRFKESYG